MADTDFRDMNRAQGAAQAGSAARTIGLIILALIVAGIIYAFMNDDADDATTGMQDTMYPTQADTGTLNGGPATEDTMTGGAAGTFESGTTIDSSDPNVIAQ